MSASDELFQLMLGRATTKAVERILDAGYRKPRTINSADELLSLPESSVVLDYEGDVSQKRGGLWCGYETAPINSNKLARMAGPVTVLWEPQP
jgi:hypothetical protein